MQSHWDNVHVHGSMDKGDVYKSGDTHYYVVRDDLFLFGGVSLEPSRLLMC